MFQSRTALQLQWRFQKKRLSHHPAQPHNGSTGQAALSRPPGYGGTSRIALCLLNFRRRELGHSQPRRGFHYIYYTLFPALFLEDIKCLVTMKRNTFCHWFCVGSLFRSPNNIHWPPSVSTLRLLHYNLYMKRRSTTCMSCGCTISSRL